MSVTIEQALKMDVKSDEFFEIYKAISDKYWTFEDPDEYQRAAACLVMFAERFESDKVILAVKIIQQIVEMAAKETKSAKLHLAFKGCDYYVDIYENENMKDDLDKMFRRAGDAFKKGNVTVKDKFGKKYF